MRIGMNPQKQSKKIDLNTYHRIIIVVYIPELTGYYQNILKVFKLSLVSIITTKNNQCAITVVNNASCQEVVDFLDNSFKKSEIDCVIHHKENIGKMDAIIGAARGTREPLITMTDVDILFKNGWQENVENIFLKIKNVGSVSPTSTRNSINYGTSSTFKSILLGKVKFTLSAIPENFEDNNRNLQSVNRKPETNTNELWPIIESNGIKAVVGSGHQVLTVRRELLFKTVPIDPCFILVGNESEFKYIDEPINRAGALRLATYNNYAHHMGNEVEDWMYDVQENNLKNKKQTTLNQISFQLPKEHFTTPSYWWYSITQRVWIKIFKKVYNLKQL